MRRTWRVDNDWLVGWIALRLRAVHDVRLIVGHSRASLMLIHGMLHGAVGRCLLWVHGVRAQRVHLRRPRVEYLTVRTCRHIRHDLLRRRRPDVLHNHLLMMWLRIIVIIHQMLSCWHVRLHWRWLLRMRMQLLAHLLLIRLIHRAEWGCRTRKRLRYGRRGGAGAGLWRRSANSVQ